MFVLEVVPYSLELAKEIVDLFGKQDRDRSPAYLSWIFSPPAGPGQIATARDGSGQLVAMLGLVTTCVMCGGQPEKSFLAVDLMVDSRARGQGLFKQLAHASMQRSKEDGAAFIWGFPNDQAAHGWFTRFGWVRLGTPPWMVRPLHSRAVTKKFGPLEWIVNFPLVRRPAPIDVRVLDRFDDSANLLWDRISGRVGCSVARSADWLNWRTVDAPGRSYRRAGAFADGELQAIVITAIEKKHGFTVLNVMEAAGSDPELLTSLIRYELYFGQQQGADLALCWCPATAFNRKSYFKAGFMPLPKRLHPAETHFGVGPLSSEGASVAARDWYVSLLDSDAV